MPNKAALTDARVSLEEERAHLRQQLTELGFGDAAGMAFDQNFADSSQVTAERAEVEALANSLNETLAEVEEALGKFEAGTYGRCERCEDEISAARLEAAPAARLCIACASRR